MATDREIARLVSLFERDDDGAAAARAVVADELEARPLAPVVGFTGAPGVGKSTLIGAVATRLARDRRIAVLAIDPSSASSGGALLGDRTRIRVPAGRVFVRSQASELETGGLGRRTYPVIRLLRRVFDLVLVETVGVGQSELDIRHVADRVYLLLQPLAGDVVQHLKAGVMEVPDAIVVTKSDAGAAAARALAEVRATIGLARPGETVPVFAVSASTGDGVELVAGDVGAAVRLSAEAERDAWFLTRAARDEAGRRGQERVERAGVPDSGSLDERLARTLVIAAG